MSFLEFFSKTMSETELNKDLKSNKNSFNNKQTQQVKNKNIQSTSILHNITFDNSLHSIVPPSSKFDKIFRSISQVQNSSHSPVPQIQPIFKKVQCSKIDQISKLKHTTPLAKNQYYQPIRNLPYYVLSIQNNSFQDEVCMSIIKDFTKGQKQRIVPTKMNFETYAQCIHNQFKTSKGLQRSIQQDSHQKLDIQINTSQINQFQKPSKKKPSQQISKQLTNRKLNSLKKSSDKQLNKSIEKQINVLPKFSEQQKQQQFVQSLKFLKLDLENEKSRVPRPIDYFEVMSKKLMNFLEYVIQDRDKFKGFTDQQIIKGVLNDIESFKGKKIDGELKTLQLQYFFTQIKQLKKYKQQMEKNQKIDIKRLEKKKEIPTSMKQKRQKQIKIEEEVPELVNISNKKTAVKKKVQKVQPKKVIPRKPEVPKANIARVTKKNNKQSMGISSIRKAVSQEDSWIGGNQIGLLIDPLTQEY